MKLALFSAWLAAAKAANMYPSMGGTASASTMSTMSSGSSGMGSDSTMSSSSSGMTPGMGTGMGLQFPDMGSSMTTNGGGVPVAASIISEASVCGDGGTSAIAWPTNTQSFSARSLAPGEAGISVSLRGSDDQLFIDLNSETAFMTAVIRVYSPGTLEPSEYNARAIPCAGDDFGRIAHATLDTKYDMTGTFTPFGRSIEELLPLTMDFTVVYSSDGSNILYTYQPIEVSAAMIGGDFNGAMGGVDVSVTGGSGSSMMGGSGSSMEETTGSGGSNMGGGSGVDMTMQFPVVGSVPIIDLGRYAGTPVTPAGVSTQSSPCSLEASISCVLRSTGQSCDTNQPRSTMCEDEALYTIEVCNIGTVGVQEFEDGNFEFLGQVGTFVQQLPSALEPQQCAVATEVRAFNACAFRTVSTSIYVRGLPSSTGNSCRTTQRNAFSTALASTQQVIQAPPVQSAVCSVDLSLRCTTAQGEPCSSLPPRGTGCREIVSYLIQICNAGVESMVVNEADLVFMGATQNLMTGNGAVPAGGCVEMTQAREIDACSGRTVTALASVVASPVDGVPCSDREEESFQIAAVTIPDPMPVTAVLPSEPCDISVSMSCKDSNGLACSGLQPRVGPVSCDETLTYEFEVCNIGNVPLIPTVANFDIGGPVQSYVDSIASRPLEPGNCVPATQSRSVNVCNSLSAKASTFVRAQPQNGPVCDAQTRSDFALLVSAPPPPPPPPTRNFMDFWSLGTVGRTTPSPPPPPPPPVVIQQPPPPPPPPVVIQQPPPPPPPPVVIQQPPQQVIVQQRPQQIYVQQPPQQVIVQQRPQQIYVPQPQQVIVQQTSGRIFGGGVPIFGGNPVPQPVPGPFPGPSGCYYGGKSKSKGYGRTGYGGNCGCYGGKGKGKGYGGGGNCGKSKGGGYRGYSGAYFYESLASASTVTSSTWGAVLGLCTTLFALIH